MKRKQDSGIISILEFCFLFSLFIDWVNKFRLRREKHGKYEKEKIQPIDNQ